jgi:hypothetical protein
MDKFSEARCAFGLVRVSIRVTTRRRIGRAYKKFRVEVALTGKPA